MSIILNIFGMDTRSIAKTFAMMGPSHILDPQIHLQTMNLVMFAHSQTPKWHYLKPFLQLKSWKDLKNSSRTNSYFEKWDIGKYDKLDKFLTDPDNISLAQKEMNIFCFKIRSWINNDYISLHSQPSESPKDT